MKNVTILVCALLVACSSDSRIDVASSEEQPIDANQLPLNSCLAGEKMTVYPYVINVHDIDLNRDYEEFITGENLPDDPTKDNERLSAVTRLIYDEFPDAFDFLQLHTSRSLPTGFGAFFHLVREKANLGLGRAIDFTDPEPYGSTSKLKGIVNVVDPALFGVTTHELFHHTDYRPFQVMTQEIYLTGGFGFSTQDHLFGRLADNTAGELFAGPHRAFGPLSGLYNIGLGVPLSELSCEADSTKKYPCDIDAKGRQRLLVPKPDLGVRPGTAPLLELYMMGLADFNELEDDIKLLTGYSVERDDNGNEVLVLDKVVDVPLEAFNNIYPPEAPLSEVDRTVQMAFVIVSPEKLDESIVSPISEWAKHYGLPSAGESSPLRNWHEFTGGRSRMLTQLCINQ